jgi:5'-3' exonuclease
MGIKDLWPMLVKCQHQNLVADLPTKFGIQRVAIDANLIGYGDYCASWKEIVGTSNMNFAYCLQRMIAKMLAYQEKFRRAGISVIWCFDGDKSDSKLATKRRMDIKNEKLDVILNLYKRGRQIERILGMETYLVNYRSMLDTLIIHDVDPNAQSEATGNDITVLTEIISQMSTMLKSYPILPRGLMDSVMDMLKSNNSECIRVPEISEAEKLCAILTTIGQADAVFGDDSDLIPLGSNIIIKDMKGNQAYVYLMKDILEFLGLNRQELIDLSIILGCDFNERTPRHGPVTALKTVRKPGFNMKDHEAKHGNEIVRAQVCNEFLSISEKDLSLVAKLLATQ